MATIGFLGLGHMGAPMALNLLKNNQICVFDIVPAAREPYRNSHAKIANSIAEAVEDKKIIFTMLPTGKEAQAAYLGPEGILANVAPETLLIDCSTIDVATARYLHQCAREKNLMMLDAPVSGGVNGAKAGTLTFMVGGDKATFERAKPYLQQMGKNIFYAGVAGNGQAAKICNNMLLGIQMLGVAEAFTLAEKLGLDAQVFFDISSVSSGQCWSMTQYNPVPGLTPSAPSNQDYAAGFSAQMMLKDLHLSQMAATSVSAATPLGAEATAMYALLSNLGYSQKDFSIIIKLIAGKMTA